MARGCSVNGDLLSDVLKLVRLTGALMFTLDAAGDWGIAGDTTASQFAAVLPPDTSNVISLYVVIEGVGWIRLAASEWVPVPAGHAAVITHSGPHELGARPGCPAAPFEHLLDGRPLPAVRSLWLVRGPDPGPTRLLCGFLGCDRRAFDPLCYALPPLFQVDLGARMQTLVSYAVANALDDSPGAAGLRERLAELLYLAAVRVHMRDLPDGAPGWLAGLRDPVVGRALRALHAEPARRWSVDALATTAASSRSALAARFSDMLGEAPMHYLTHLRLALAARQLADSRKSLATIAAEVGYDSPAAFQRAFKRDFGVPPAAWRRNAAHAATARQGQPPVPVGCASAQARCVGTARRADAIDDGVA